MPTPARHLRAIAATCLVTAALLATAAGPAAALEPPRPLPGYRPAFVTETDTRPWQDCLWASGAMLLDKWTNGTVQVSRQTLRSLSGDHTGGSTLEDLRTASAKLGIDLAYSPDGGARITWSQLLSRLEHGAGAVLLGDYSKLPERYGRWDPAFWQATGDKDNHAVYIERYDRRYGRVWLMDPLGRGEWRGEWISVRALRRYAWTTSGGFLSVAVTPTAKPAPFAGVTLGAPTVSLNPASLDVAWSLGTPPGWRFPGADISTAFSPSPDALALAVLPRAAPADAAPVTAPSAPMATVSGHSLHATTPLPAGPGAYVVGTTVTERRFGTVVARAGDIPLFVSGPRRATLRIHATGGTVLAGAAIPVSVSVANTGDLSWVEDARAVGIPAEVFASRDTRLVARWIRVDDAARLAGIPPPPGRAASESWPIAGAVMATRSTRIPDAAQVFGPIVVPGADPGAARETPPDIELGRVPLEPGQLVEIGSEIPAPDLPGTWALVVDVVDDVDGSFAAQGSVPAVAAFVVIASRGIEPVD